MNENILEIDGEIQQLLNSRELDDLSPDNSLQDRYDAINDIYVEYQNLFENDLLDAGEEEEEYDDNVDNYVSIIQNIIDNNPEELDLDLVNNLFDLQNILKIFSIIITEHLIENSDNISELEKNQIESLKLNFDFLIQDIESLSENFEYDNEDVGQNSRQN